MTSAPTTPIVYVAVADYAVAAEEGVLSCVGLGSCVALILFDREQRLGGMAHVLLPSESLSRDRAKPAKFGSTAVGFLERELRRHGSGGSRDLVAWLVGGASMFGALLTSGINMGERNASAVRDALREAGIAIVGEDVGGDYGRTVHFDVAQGSVRVTTMRHGERFL